MNPNRFLERIRFGMIAKLRGVTTMNAKHALISSIRSQVYKKKKEDNQRYFMHKRFLTSTGKASQTNKIFTARRNNDSVLAADKTI